MRKFIIAAAGLAALAACSRTKDGDIIVQRPTGITTTTDTLHTPTVTTRTDTINTPVIGTKTETLVVKKPVVGTQKTAVKVPVVQKRKPD